MDAKQSQLLYETALQSAYEGNYKTALRQIEEALEQVEQPGFLLAKGRILAQMGRWSEAIEALEKIPDGTKEHLSAQLAIAKVHELRKQGWFRRMGRDPVIFIGSVISVVVLLGLTSLLAVMLYMSRTDPTIQQSLKSVILRTEKLHSDLIGARKDLNRSIRESRESVQAEIESLGKKWVAVQEASDRRVQAWRSEQTQQLESLGAANQQLSVVMDQTHNELATLDKRLSGVEGTYRDAFNELSQTMLKSRESAQAEIEALGKKWVTVQEASDRRVQVWRSEQTQQMESLVEADHQLSVAVDQTHNELSTLDERLSGVESSFRDSFEGMLQKEVLLLEGLRELMEKSEYLISLLKASSKQGNKKKMAYP